MLSDWFITNSKQLRNAGKVGRLEMVEREILASGSPSWVQWCFVGL